tara:strand:- start:42 stop:338 length:297 start_codon:yes stop_codon:yes gene_type:complete
MLSPVKNMNKQHIETFISERFGTGDKIYADEWRIRFGVLDCETQIPWQMDLQSRRVWGKVTGRKYGLIKYNYSEDPVYVIVDLTTGNVIDSTGDKKEE